MASAPLSRRRRRAGPADRRGRRPGDWLVVGGGGRRRPSISSPRGGRSTRSPTAPIHVVGTLRLQPRAATPVPRSASASGVSAVLAVAGHRRDRGRPRLAAAAASDRRGSVVALGLVLGGALGNLVDRLFRGLAASCAAPSSTSSTSSGGPSSTWPTSAVVDRRASCWSSRCASAPATRRRLSRPMDEIVPPALAGERLDRVVAWSPASAGRGRRR